MSIKFVLAPQSDRSPLNGVKGVTIDGDIVSFGEGWTEGTAKALLNLTEPTKQASFEVSKKGFEPDEEDKRILTQGLGIEEADFDGLAFIQIKAANTKLDRHEERFTPAFLDKLAEIANAEFTSIVNVHDGRGGTYGRAFRSFTEMDNEGVTWLIQKSYVAKDAMLPNGVSIETALKKKLIRHTSISFGARAEWKELPNGNSFGLYDYKEGDRVEFIHNSFVELGAQRGAMIKTYKSFDPGNAPGNGNAPKVKETQPIKKVTHMITFNSKAFEGEDPTKELLAEANAVLKELTDAKAEIEIMKVEKEANAAKLTEHEEARNAAKEGIKTLQGQDGLRLPVSEQWSEKMIGVSTLKELQAKHESLKLKFEEENPEGQTKGAGKANKGKAKKNPILLSNNSEE